MFALLILTLCVASAPTPPLALAHPGALRPPLPAPPPPAITFLSDASIKRRKAVPMEVNSRRGTLVAKTQEISNFRVPQDTVVVTADGTRLSSADLHGLSLPFSLSSTLSDEEQQQLEPRPAYGQPPTSLPMQREAPEWPPEIPPEMPPEPVTTEYGEDVVYRSPSPETVVTYYSLTAPSQRTSVKMMPYSSLVEFLVGKHAYDPPVHHTPKTKIETTTPPPYPINRIRPARVYGDPGSLPEINEGNR